MSLLAQRFRSVVSKSKDLKLKGESSPNICYSTGFIAFDYLNGYIVHVKNEEKNIDTKYYNVGIQDGTMNLFIGRSQCGKSTFALQVGYNIIKDFPNACFYHDDIEGGLNDARKVQLAGVDSLEELKKKYICRDTGNTTENVYERIKMIADEKISHPEDYMYDTGKIDEQGNNIMKLEPTVYLIDSMAILVPEQFSDCEDLGTAMSIPAVTKKNTQMLKWILPLLKSANIILFIINHILPDISIMPKKGQLRYLKPGERITGGETQIYLASNCIRFDDSKLRADKGFGLGHDGAIIDASLVKSRSNITGRPIPLLFDPNLGYDPDLSILLLLKANNKIEGGGFMHVVGSDIKFRQKEFKQKLRDSLNPNITSESPQFAKEVMIAVSEILKQLVVDNEQTEVLNRNENFSNSLLDMMNNALVA